MRRFATELKLKLFTILLSLLLMVAFFQNCGEGFHVNNSEKTSSLQNIDSLNLKYSAQEDKSISVNLYEETSSLKIKSIYINMPPNNGKVTLTNGEFIFTPDQNYFGEINFSVTASKDDRGLVLIYVVIDYSPINDPPMVTNIDIYANNSEVVSGQLPAFDIDGDLLEYRILSPPSKGSINDFNAADGSFNFIPNNSGSAPDFFTYQVSDGVALSNIGTVNIN